MLTFTWLVSNGTELDTEARVIEAKFGDGYAQRTGDGLNSTPSNYSVKMQNVKASDALAVIDFFKTHGGHTPFLWTPPNEGSPRQFVCKKWNMVSVFVGTKDIFATFEEDFSP